MFETVILKYTFAMFTMAYDISKKEMCPSHLIEALYSLAVTSPLPAVSLLLSQINHLVPRCRIRSFGVCLDIVLWIMKISAFTSNKIWVCTSAGPTCVAWWLSSHLYHALHPCPLLLQQAQVVLQAFTLDTHFPVYDLASF